MCSSRENVQNNRLNLQDDLTLMETYVPDISKDIILPEELNRYLRDQIRHYTSENEKLKTNLLKSHEMLEQSTSEIKSLQSQLEKYKTPISSKSFTSVNEIASIKIVELSKKLREKSSEVEALKTKCSKLEQRIYELEKENRNKLDYVPVKEEIPINESEEQIKQLQEKLNHITAKLFEVKNSNTQLKNDLKLANKYLLQEVGETFEKLQSNVNNSNWRGRSQIICDLQQKNSELKEKLKTMQDLCHNSTRKDRENPLVSVLEKKHEVLTKENSDLKNELTEYKKKFECLKSRFKVIENEYNILKMKSASLNDQSQRDQEIIKTLTAQLANIQNNNNDLLKQKQNIINKLEKELKSFSFELEREKLKCDTLMKQNKSLIEDRERNISTYKNIQQMMPNVKEEKKSLNILQVEKFRLLELIKTANDRLDKERNAHLNTQLQLKSERQKVAKIEAKLALLQLNRNGDKCNYSSKSKDHSLEDKLVIAEENIKILETRLEIEKHERQLDFEEFSNILLDYQKKI